MSKDKGLCSLKSLLMASLVVVILLGGALWKFNQGVKATQKEASHELEFIHAGAQLATASDYLTAEARAFSVTGDVQHLNNYWREVEVTKRRDDSVETMKRLSPDSDLVSLLTESKNNSDALINTELESMRAVLEANDVDSSDMPKAVADFDLPSSMENLSPEDKILTAQKILFDAKYYSDKQLIMQPIEDFKKIVLDNFDVKKQEKSASIGTFINIIAGLLFVLLVLILNMMCVRARGSDDA